MMSCTKFLDIAQEDNESISGAVNMSGTDPGSHCFQEGADLGFPGAFLLGSQSPQRYGGGVGVLSTSTMQTASKRTRMESEWVVGWGWGASRGTGDLGM